MTRPLIVRRLDVAIARVTDLGDQILAIYLTASDRALLTRWYSHRWRRKLGSSAIFHPCDYREHPLRTGKRSVIYTDHGLSITVPRRA